jgi:hypothetical protein
MLLEHLLKQTLSKQMVKKCFYKDKNCLAFLDKMFFKKFLNKSCQTTLAQKFVWIKVVEPILFEQM